MKYSIRIYESLPQPIFRQVLRLSCSGFPLSLKIQIMPVAMFRPCFFFVAPAVNIQAFLWCLYGECSYKQNSLDYYLDSGYYYWLAVRHFNQDGSGWYNLYVDYHAPVQYTLYYNGNINTGGSAPASQGFYENRTFYLQTNYNNLSKTGYTFDGWNTRADGTGTNYSAGQLVAFSAGNITLYAKWKLNSVTPGPATITSPTENGTSYKLLNRYSVEYTASNATKYHVAVKIIDGNPDPNSDNEAGTSILNNAESTSTSASFTNPGTTTQAGKWVKLYARGGNNAGVYGVPDIKYVQIQPLTPVLKTPTASNGTVSLSWDATDGAVSYRLYRSISSTTGFTLIKSGITATNTTDSPGAGIYYYKVAAVAKTTSSTDSRILSKGVEGPLSYFQGITVPPVATTVTITWNPNGGSVSPTSETKTIGATFGTLPTPARAGFDFDGWWTGAGGTGTRIYSTSTVPSEDRMYYAKWNTPSAITLTLNNPTTVNIVAGSRREVSFTAPTTNTYYFESTDRGTLDPKAYVSSSGSNIWDDDSGTDFRNYKFQRALNAGQKFTYFSGIHNDANVNGSYKVTVTSSPTYTLTNNVSKATIDKSVLTYNTKYEGTLYADAGYNLPVAITVMRGSYNLRDYVTYEQSTGKITIAAAQVTADMTISGATVLAPTVDINVYSEINSDYYKNIAKSAAESFDKTFGLKMNVNTNGTVVLNNLKIEVCPEHAGGLEGTCTLPWCHNDYLNNGSSSTLRKYYETWKIKDNLIQYLITAKKGINTVFVDYYLFERTLGDCESRR